MMPDMERIVVGVDGSDESWAGFQTALDLAGPAGAAVTAVHVEHLSAWATLAIGSTLGDAFEADEKVRAELIDQAQNQGSAAGVPVDVVVRKGRPANEIVDVAQEVGADLVVVGHRGHGGATSWLGSVATEVVHRAHCSVLVAR
jgi:nucleotide-binding universal stress UspA family protein